MLDRQTLWLRLAAAQQRLQDLLRGQTIIECRKDLAVDSTAYRHKMAPVIDFGAEGIRPAVHLVVRIGQQGTRQVNGFGVGTAGNQVTPRVGRVVPEHGVGTDYPDGEAAVSRRRGFGGDERENASGAEAPVDLRVVIDLDRLVALVGHMSGDPGLAFVDENSAAGNVGQ
ncbi:Uncharacterised protein [Mycobacteroides abscessus subsp. massiliense]|nr:Uncharacterised protein [Mycobacteroides abscessus subsp. massiliense]